MIGQEQARAGGGTRILREAYHDLDLDEPDMPMEVVSVKAALNYIAFGRFAQGEPYDIFLSYGASRIKRRRVVELGALSAAVRTLCRAVRLGKVRVFEVEEQELWADESIKDFTPPIVYLWEVSPDVFPQHFWSLSDMDPAYFAIHTEEDVLPRNVVFAVSDIADLADPADTDNDDPLDAPPVAEPQRSAGGRKAGTNGAPIAKFILRLQALGEAVAAAETHETLGAWLREEYARLGLKEPNPDNAKRDAVGARRQLWGETV